MLTTSEKDFKELEYQFSSVQKLAKEFRLPVLILFEYTTDKRKIKEIINQYIVPLDARGYKFHYTTKKILKQIKKPKWYFYWSNIPSVDRFAIWDKSWYSLKSYKLKEIRYFEEQLSHQILFIKFYLFQDKLSRKEQSIIRKTNFSFSFWNLISINQKTKKEILSELYKITIQAIHHKINEIKSKQLIYDSKINLDKQNTILQKINLNKSLTEKEYIENLDYLQNKLKKLHNKLIKKNIPLIILLEGWDAAGKGGTIKRIVKELNPRFYNVIPISAPNDLEKKFPYLWRFWKSLPDKGNLTIFDRSWYGRVLVERIEGFCTAEEWQNAYEEINYFEKQLIEWGAIILKFWLHIDKETQLERFKERENNPFKKWKITEEDWRNREKWDYYEIAFDDLYQKTNTDYAPWHIIEFNYKWYGRIKVLKTIVNTIEKRID
jgi:polyphosphate kinase 2 (PPK2 family)